MPTYEFRHLTPVTDCADPFELFGPVSQADLTICPQCGAPIQRVLSAAGVVSGKAHVMKEAHFSQRGFTQYRKLEKGVYEKTAGQGPAIIKDDGKPL